jgi:hypothetical protein
MQRLPCGSVLPYRLQLVERERAVRCGQLLYSRQRHQRGVHGVSCGDVQREQRVSCVERVPGVSCGGVLPCGQQLVKRERALCCGQLLDCGERPECSVHAMSCRSILLNRLCKQWRQRGVCCRQLFCDWQWHGRAVHVVPRWGVLPCRLQLVERERALRRGQLLDCGQRHQ